MTSLTTLLNFIGGNKFDRQNFSASDFILERKIALLTHAGITSDYFIDMDFIPNLKNTSQLIINVSSLPSNRLVNMINIIYLVLV